MAAVMSVVNMLRSSACVALVFCVIVVDLSVDGERLSAGRSSGRMSGGSRVRHSRISGTATKAGIVGGLLFGSAAYMNRRRYQNGYYSPTVCENPKYGRFICPMESQPDSYGYCCGYDGLESCCMASMHNDLSAGRIAGIVIGVVVVVVGMCVIRHLIKNRADLRRSKGETISPPAEDMAHYQAAAQAPVNQWQHDKNDMQMMNDPYSPYQGGGGPPYPNSAAPYPAGDPNAYPAAPMPNPAPTFPSNIAQDGSTQPPYPAYQPGGATPYPVNREYDPAPPYSDSQGYDPAPPYRDSQGDDTAPPYPATTGVSLEAPPPGYDEAVYGRYACATDKYPPNTSKSDARDMSAAL